MNGRENRPINGVSRSHTHAAILACSHAQCDCSHSYISHHYRFSPSIFFFIIFSFVAAFFICHCVAMRSMLYIAHDHLRKINVSIFYLPTAAATHHRPSDSRLVLGFFFHSFSFCHGFAWWFILACARWCVWLCLERVRLRFRQQ